MDTAGWQEAPNTATRVIMVRLPQVPEMQSGLLGTVDLIHFAVQTTKPHAVVGTNLADLPPSTHRQSITEGTSVESEQHGFRIVHASRHQHAVAKAED